MELSDYHTLSDGKVQFSSVLLLFCPNPEPDHRFSSVDLPETRTEPLVQVHIGPVRGGEGPNPEPNVNEDNKRSLLT